MSLTLFANLLFKTFSSKEFESILEKYKMQKSFT